jgi:site-specific recombinase XerD
VDFEPFLSHWATRKKASPHTIRAYRNDLKLFDSFCRDRGIRRLDQVDYAVCNGFIEHMQQQSNPRFHRTGLADASIARRLAAVSSYFEYKRATSNPKLRNPLRDLTRKWTKNDAPKPVDDLTLEELVNGITNERDRVLITMFLATGLRASEMHQMDRDTVRFELEVDEQGQEHFRASGEVVGKGDKKRTFFVDESTQELYAHYLSTRTDNHPALFLSERRQRMSVRAIQRTLQAWCKKLGLSHVNVHALRHSYASRLANANISSMVLKDLMGHNSFSTTQRYFKLHDTTLARGYFSAMEWVRKGPSV